MSELISIIIPTYKRPSKLGRAIDSCLNQTYKNIEVVVVDDNIPGSEYRIKTSEVMKKYSHNKKVKYLKMEKNSGGAISRNFGIENSHGDYIAFLDDDDYFLENKLYLQLKYMKEKKLDACFTGSRTYDETANKVVKEKRYSNFEEYDNVLKFHLVEMIVSTQTFMFKKDVLNKVGGFSAVPAGQEYFLMYKVIINGFCVGYLDKILTVICVHSGERITTGAKKVIGEKFLYDLKKKHFNILKYKQIRKIKYIYKRNIWKKYVDDSSYKCFFWLIFLIISHPIILLKKIINRGQL